MELERISCRREDERPRESLTMKYDSSSGERLRLAHVCSLPLDQRSVDRLKLSCLVLRQLRLVLDAWRFGSAARQAPSPDFRPWESYQFKGSLLR